MPKRQTDEFGFVILSDEEKLNRRKFFQKLRWIRGGGVVGQAHSCRGLCDNFVKQKRPPTENEYVKGVYWCKECGIRIPVVRCRCCGHKGRRGVRRRKNVKRI